jgi:hypothetical protein
MIEYHMASEADVEQLAVMRWDFRREEAPGTYAIDQTTFIQQCAAFLRQGLASNQWTCWVAVRDGSIITHIFVQRIAKVPKPNRLDDAYGYVTNVYTRPSRARDWHAPHAARHRVGSRIRSGIPDRVAE